MVGAAKPARFPIWVALILLVPALVSADGEFSARQFGRMIGAALVPALLTMVAYNSGSRRAVILTAVISSALVTSSLQYSAGRAVRVHKQHEDALVGRIATAVQRVDEWSDAGGLLALGTDDPKVLQRRQDLARVAKEEFAWLVEQTGQAGLTRALVEGGVDDDRARSYVESRGNAALLWQEQRLFECQRDVFAAVERLFRVLGRERRWRVPEGGTVLDCAFAPEADAELVRAAEKAIADIEAADRQRRTYVKEMGGAAKR